jgi:hypothetical protein
MIALLLPLVVLCVVDLIRGDSNLNVTLIVSCAVCDKLSLTTVGTDQWVRRALLC